MPGEPLLLIHGFTGTPAVWDPVRPALEERHDVLAVTLLGHCEGKEFPADVAPSFVALADGLEREMDKAGWDTAHVVGNSLGGWLALELGRRGRARSVVALAPAGGWEAGSPDEKRLHRMFMVNHRLLKFIGPRAHKLVRRPRLRALILRDAMAHPERLTPAEAFGMLDGAARCPGYLPLLEAIMRDGPPSDLSGIDAPVRIVWGTRDRIIPHDRYSARLRRMIPDAEYIELPGLGHVPMFDDPALVTRTILEVTAPAQTPAATI